MPGASSEWDTGAPIVYDEAPPEEQSAIARLRAAAAEYVAEFARLFSLRDVAERDPDLYAEWNDVVSAAQTVRNSIEWITSSIDAASGAVSGVFDFFQSRAPGGLMGLSRVAGNTLGIAPLAVFGLSLAAVTAATAALLATIDRMRITSAKLEAVKAGTASPEIFTDDWGNPITQTGSAIKWIIIGAAVFFIAPRVLDMLKR